MTEKLHEIKWSMSFVAKDADGKVVELKSDNIKDEFVRVKTLSTTGEVLVPRDPGQDGKNYVERNIQAQPKNELEFLLIRTYLLVREGEDPLSTKEREAVFDRLRYAFTDQDNVYQDGDWRPLRGPQLFVNGAAEWLNPEPRKVAFKFTEKTDRDVYIRVDVGRGRPDSDA